MPSLSHIIEATLNKIEDLYGIGFRVQLESSLLGSYCLLFTLRFCSSLHLGSDWYCLQM